MTRVIGHRGAPHAARENTTAAFRAAAAMGADMVELDVRRTADAALVVHHDASLADGRLIVELDQRDLPEWLPDLEAALDACAGMDINVEIKNWQLDPDYDAGDLVAAGVASVIGGRGIQERVVVSSFNLATIDAVHAVDPSIPTGWLTFPGADALPLIARTAAAGHVAFHPHNASVTAEVVTAAHAAGLAINVWTVDDLDRICELASWGVDGIVTNVPDAAIAALRS